MSALPDTQTKAALAGARLFLKRRKAALVASAGRGAGRLGPVPAAASVVAGATLGCVPGLIDEFLDAGPVVIVVEAVDDDWAAALGRAVRDCVLTNERLPPKVDANSCIAKPDSETGRKPQSASPVRVYAGPCRISDKESKDAAASIADMCSVVAIARDPGRELPPPVIRAADHRLVAERLDADLLALVVEAVVGTRPKKTVSAELLPLLDLDDIRLAIHRERGADGCIDRLEALLRRRIRTSSAEQPRLADLHGYGAAGEWGRSLAEDLKAYARQEISAADLPRGGVFWGPSGVGKTLLAAAIAAEAGVPLVVGSLGRWQSAGEAHLGTTCRAMRQFFTDAMRQAPCIAFVDELDSFGDRTTFRDYNRDYSTQIVNTFLECLDGAEQRDGVVLLGATNQPGRIDPAITRSGRFDRMIEIKLPGKGDLESILRHHLGRDLKDADLEEVARRSVGGTGADCAALVRRARSRARRHGRPVALDDLLAEIDVAVEPMDVAIEWRIAIHEAGHAVVAHELDYDLGVVTLRSPDPRRRAFATAARKCATTRSSASDLLVCLLAGRAAEILLVGECSAGGALDLAAATSIAWSLHYEWGLGETLSVLQPGSPDADAEIVETELRLAEAKADGILASRRCALHRVAAALVARSSLEGHEIADLVGRSCNDGESTIPSGSS